MSRFYPRNIAFHMLSAFRLSNLRIAALAALAIHLEPLALAHEFDSSAIGCLGTSCRGGATDDVDLSLIQLHVQESRTLRRSYDDLLGSASDPQDFGAIEADNLPENVTAAQGSHTSARPDELVRGTAGRSIVFIKVPKTGGSTLSGILRRVGARRNLAHTGDGPEWIKKDRNGRSDAIWANHGARRTLAKQLESRMPGAFYVMSLRDPVSRCLSAFYHWGVQKKQVTPSTSEKLTALTKCGKSFMSKYIEVAYNQRADNIITDYDAFVLTERFDESLLIARHKMNASLVDLLYLRVKDSSELGRRRNESRHIPLSEEPLEVRNLAAKIRESSEDAVLYDLANREIDRLVAERKQRHQDELRQFRDMLKEVKEACPLKYQDCLWGDNGCEQRCIDELAVARGWA